MGCRGVFVKAQDVILQVGTEGGDSSGERAGGRAGTASSVPPLPDAHFPGSEEGVRLLILCVRRGAVCSLVEWGEGDRVCTCVSWTKITLRRTRKLLSSFLPQVEGEGK